MKRIYLLFGIGALLGASVAEAHHSFAKAYAEEKQVTLEGNVVSFEFRNPHTWVYFMANDATGVVRKYGAEWANPRRLEQAGLTATTLKLGDRVVVTGAPSRNDTTYAVHLKSIKRPADGWSWPNRGGR